MPGLKRKMSVSARKQSKIGIIHEEEEDEEDNE